MSKLKLRGALATASPNTDRVNGVKHEDGHITTGI